MNISLLYTLQFNSSKSDFDSQFNAYIFHKLWKRNHQFFIFVLTPKPLNGLNLTMINTF